MSYLEEVFEAPSIVGASSYYKHCEQKYHSHYYYWECWNKIKKPSHHKKHNEHNQHKYYDGNQGSDETYESNGFDSSEPLIDPLTV